ncbi:hypothetical protein IMSAGC009_04034 [Lachnospiraceae bacterium]|nr:hypothetical protein IMSAGC009_04034 [Lachnospiraceae bacterium]
MISTHAGPCPAFTLTSDTFKVSSGAEVSCMGASCGGSSGSGSDDVSREVSKLRGSERVSGDGDGSRPGDGDGAGVPAASCLSLFPGPELSSPPVLPPRPASSCFPVLPSCPALSCSPVLPSCPASSCSLPPLSGPAMLPSFCRLPSSAVIPASINPSAAPPVSFSTSNTASNTREAFATFPAESLTA